MQWYTRDARNSVRTSDLKNIEKSLELYALEVWTYPEPDNINETPKIRWMLEWKFGETNFKQVKKLDTLPKDPKTWELYDYNLVITKDAYELISKEWEWEEIKLWPLNKNWVYVNEETGYIFKKKNKTWPDSNCPLNDVEVYSYTWNLVQVWAWCNSTLWDWLEWWKIEDWSNWTIETCYPNYDWVKDVSKCQIWDPKMQSNAIANSWFSWTNLNWDREYATIWWKLYTWEKAKDTACPSWWKLPRDEEWTSLENIISWTTCRTWVWRQCEWLWWKWHESKWVWNNLANILDIDLTGVYNLDSFKNRWFITILWNSNTYINYAHGRGYSWGYYTTYRDVWPQEFAFSARCIKD